MTLKKPNNRKHKMLRKLNYKALCYMDKQQVWVKDLENDIYNQLCIVKVIYDFTTVGKKGYEHQEPFISGVKLENEEYIFEYNWKGECVNGEFEVYSSSHGKIKEITDV